MDSQTDTKIQKDYGVSLRVSRAVRSDLALFKRYRRETFNEVVERLIRNEKIRIADPRVGDQIS